MIYWELFITFVLIGSLSFGGGYAVLPLIEEELVLNHGWMSATEFVDVLTLSEMTPGPIAINSATFAGNRVAGIMGGIVSTIGVILPSLVITLTVAYFYFKYKNLHLVQGIIQGLRPAVVALIASAGVTILMSAFLGQSSAGNLSLADVNWINVGLFAAGIYLMRRFDLSPIQTIIGCGAVGGLIFTLI